MSDVIEKEARRNKFEDYPDLAQWMESLANSNIEGMSLASWNDFCNSVNSALSKAEAASEMREALKAAESVLRMLTEPTDEQLQMTNLQAWTRSVEVSRKCSPKLRRANGR